MDQLTTPNTNINQRRIRTPRNWWERICAICALMLALAGSIGAPPPLRQQQVANAQESDGSVIVMLDDDADPWEAAARMGIVPTQVYFHVFRGFAGKLPEVSAQSLEGDPEVIDIAPDLPVLAAADRLPTGVDRVDAEQNVGGRVLGVGNLVGLNLVNADVAILDTGIDPTHPDLNVAGGVDCTNTGSWTDDNGHGTHIAGTVGALDNGAGVIGVAPGARLWAVKVLDAANHGSWSQIICGLDWVVANANQIDVANLSLSGPGTSGSCTSESLHRAICAAVNAGVTVVAAAGNASADAGAYVPAAYPEVITVSAFTDFNGKPGGGASANCTTGGVDDTFGTYSNYGAVVDIAAPGTCIDSTKPGNTYGYMTGTSMAAPHVAGAIALYRATNPLASPSAIRDWVLSTARAQTSSYGFTGGKSGEPVLFLGTPPDDGGIGIDIGITFPGIGIGIGIGLGGSNPTATRTRTATASPAPSSTPTRAPQPTATPTRTPTMQSSPTSTKTSTPLPTATNSPSPIPTSTPTRTQTPIPSATATATRTATSIATSTSTPRPTMTATITPTVTMSPSSTATSTVTVTRTPTATATITRSPTAAASATQSPTRTATATQSATRTATATQSPTRTATSTQSPTRTATSTRTPTRPATLTPTATFTRTPTRVPATFTPTRTPTRQATVTRTSTRTPSVTRTATASRTPTVTRTPTKSTTPTATRTPTRTGTAVAKGSGEMASGTTGSLVVNTVDRGGEPLPGACFALEQQNERVAQSCDGDDGKNDGTTTFDQIPASTYRLIEVQPPGDFSPTRSKSVRVRVDRVTHLTIKHR